jgi:hypothetical protein
METWRDILGYEGLYQISDEGNVKSLDRNVEALSRWGKKRTMFFKGKELEKCLGTNNYYHVVLSKDGKTNTFDIHPLVWKTFNGDIPEGYVINHKDENKTNNKLSNLELLTIEGNTNYGTAISRMSKSKAREVYQYTLEGELVATYQSTKEAAQANNYDQSSISACARGKKSCITYKGYKWSYNPL